MKVLRDHAGNEAEESSGADVIKQKVGGLRVPHRAPVAAGIPARQPRQTEGAQPISGAFIQGLHSAGDEPNLIERAARLHASDPLGNQRQNVQAFELIEGVERGAPIGVLAQSEADRAHQATDRLRFRTRSLVR